MDRTQRLLEENRRAVLAVAHALETHKTVTGDDIQAIIEGRPGTLIDGTPYGTAEFDRLAEDYHNRVVAAHKGHGKVDIPLPLLNGRYRVAPAPGRRPGRGGAQRGRTGRPGVPPPGAPAARGPQRRRRPNRQRGRRRVQVRSGAGHGTHLGDRQCRQHHRGR